MAFNEGEELIAVNFNFILRFGLGNTEYRKRTLGPSLFLLETSWSEYKETNMMKPVLINMGEFHLSTCALCVDF